MLDTRHFPIGIWNYAPIARFDEARVDEWLDCGLTLPMGPVFADTPQDIAHMRQILQWADQRDLQVILDDARLYDYRNPQYGQLVERTRADFDDCPALFGCRVMDEPGADAWHGVAQACRILRQTAPEIEPFVNHLPWHAGVERRLGCENMDAYLDVFVAESGVHFLSYDNYSQLLPEGQGLAQYWYNLATYRAAAQRHGIPFWNTILSVGHFHYRCPNDDDIRWQFYTSLAYGAKGILYFFFYMRFPHDNYRLAPIDELWSRTATYDMLRRVNRGFLRKWAPLMLELANTSVAHWPYWPWPIPGTQQWRPSPVLQRVEADRRHLLLSEFVDGQGRPYVMVVNDSTTESTHATLSFGAPAARAFVRNWDGIEVPCETWQRDGLTAVAQWLAPGQAELYRVELA